MCDSPKHACIRCRKSFDTEQKLKRHGYYCRQKAVHGRSTRRRSCEPCAKAKTRCDSKLPFCTICLKRGTECRYESTVLDNINELGGVQPNIILPDATLPIASFDNSDFAIPKLSTPTVTSMPSFPLLMEEEELANDTSLEMILGPVFIPNLLATGPPPEGPVELRYGMEYIPRFDISRDSSRALAPREINPAAKVSAIYIKRILGSIPSMMVRRETFPAFIHPIHCSENADGSLPTALENCMNIAKMWARRTPQTIQHVWKCIRLEHERIWFEHESYNEFNLLASVSSLLIYILMRLVDGELPCTDFDTHLLTSLHHVATTLFSSVGGLGCNHPATTGPPNKVSSYTWEQWVLYESRRRFYTVARILNMLFDADAALQCMPLPGFCIVPLPTKRLLWEAPNEEVWRREFDQLWSEASIYGLMLDGKLGKITQMGNGRTVTGEAEWEDWLGVVDCFWTIVMMAAALV